ncbi:MAG: Shikimate dehydrogenase (NADP(+)) [Chloroflexi bacterium]|nr:Shikimate dehydrogenase (NADP(+)) [Chloroflexota bacterium]
MAHKPQKYELGLIGYPIHASLSPKIHKAALEETGLAGHYRLYPVPPGEPHALADMLERVRAGEIHGLNVTIPHKQAVIPLLDELSETAAAIGAVNTISLKNGQLRGDNTDAQGFWHDLQNLLREDKMGHKPSQPPPGPPQALILGAGGAARAVAYALLQNQWTVTVAARRFEQAQSLANHYACHNTRQAPRISSSKYQASQLADLLPALSLLVNATPVGMKAHAPGSPWPEGLPLPPMAAVYDLIYNPPRTHLMRDAELAGLRVRGGMGMLVEQALIAFEIWTGRKLPSSFMV